MVVKRLSIQIGQSMEDMQRCVFGFIPNTAETAFIGLRLVPVLPGGHAWVCLQRWFVFCLCIGMIEGAMDWINELQSHCLTKVFDYCGLCDALPSIGATGWYLIPALTVQFLLFVFKQRHGVQIHLQLLPNSPFALQEPAPDAEFLEQLLALKPRVDKVNFCALNSINDTAYLSLCRLCGLCPLHAHHPYQPLIKDAKLRTFITDDSNRDDLVSHIYDVTYGSVNQVFLPAIPGDCFDHLLLQTAR